MDEEWIGTLLKEKRNCWRNDSSCLFHIRSASSPRSNLPLTFIYYIGQWPFIVCAGYPAYILALFPSKMTSFLPVIDGKLLKDRTRSFLFRNRWNIPTRRTQFPPYQASTANPVRAFGQSSKYTHCQTTFLADSSNPFLGVRMINFARVSHDLMTHVSAKSVIHLILKHVCERHGGFSGVPRSRYGAPCLLYRGRWYTAISVDYQTTPRTHTAPTPNQTNQPWTNYPAYYTLVTTIPCSYSRQ